MIFFYSPLAGNEEIVFEQEDYHYLVRVRRHRVGDDLCLQNMKDDIRFFYSIQHIEKRFLLLRLEKSEPFTPPVLSLHLGWAMCDASTIYEAIPALNQLGVKKITFLETQRSQKNIRLNPEKIKTICINSSQQCGRNHLLEWNTNSFETFIKMYPNAVCFDMTGSDILSHENFQEYLIGPEGGWTSEELALINPENRKKMKTPFVMKSEVAAIIAPSILL